MANNVIDLTTVPLEDKFRTQLSQQWTGGTGTVNVANTPNFTFPSGQTCYMVVNPGKDNMQIAEIDSYNAGAGTVNVSNITLEKGASINSTAQTHAVGSEVIISDNYQVWSDILDAVNSKVAQSTGQVTAYADATARDAAITAPANGMQVYLTTEGVFTDYIGGSWTTRAADTTANASETVAGRVEIATTAEIEARTDTGGTGATNAVIPSKLGNTTIGFSGEVRLWTTTTAPTGWLLCDGSAVSRTTYADLFAIISTTYGVGDGSTTFNLPDLQGNIPVGRDSGDSDFDTMGETGGSKTHTLTTDEIPAHTHSVAYGDNLASSGNAARVVDNSTGSFTSGSAGGGNAHNNVQPYIVLNYIIKT